MARCTCGAWATSVPTAHSDWCDVNRSTKGLLPVYFYEGVNKDWVVCVYCENVRQLSQVVRFLTNEGLVTCPEDTFVSAAHRTEETYETFEKEFGHWASWNKVA